MAKFQLVTHKAIKTLFSYKIIIEKLNFSGAPGRTGRMRKSNLSFHFFLCFISNRFLAQIVFLAQNIHFPFLSGDANFFLLKKIKNAKKWIKNHIRICTCLDFYHHI